MAFFDLTTWKTMVKLLTFYSDCATILTAPSYMEFFFF